MVSDDTCSSHQQCGDIVNKVSNVQELVENITTQDRARCLKSGKLNCGTRILSLSCNVYVKIRAIPPSRVIVVHGKPYTMPWEGWAKCLTRNCTEVHHVTNQIEGVGKMAKWWMMLPSYRTMSQNYLSRTMDNGHVNHPPGTVYSLVFNLDNTMPMFVHHQTLLQILIPAEQISSPYPLHPYWSRGATVPAS